MSCRALKSFARTVATVAALGAGTVAYAQTTTTETPANANDKLDPPEVQVNTPSTQRAAEQTLPECPPGEEAAAPAPTPPPPVAEAPPPAPARRANRIFAPQQIALTTGVGAANYFGTPTAGAGIDAGPAYNARVMMGAHSVIALEAAYMGSSNPVDVPGTHGALSSNGFDGDLRLQVPTRVEPYIFSGVGYNHMKVNNTGQRAGMLNEEDNQVTIPAGGGVTGYVGKHAALDVRGTYRYIPNNGITIMNDRSLHQWIAQANVGWVF